MVLISGSVSLFPAGALVFSLGESSPCTFSALWTDNCGKSASESSRVLLLWILIKATNVSLAFQTGIDGALPSCPSISQVNLACRQRPRTVEGASARPPCRAPDSVRLGFPLRDANTGAGQDFTGLAAAVQLRLRVAVGLQALQRCSGLFKPQSTGQHRGNPPAFARCVAASEGCRAVAHGAKAGFRREPRPSGHVERVDHAARASAGLRRANRARPGPSADGHRGSELRPRAQEAPEAVRENHP